MIMELFDRHFSRVAFILAALFMLAAFAEGFVNLLGQSLIARVYSPGRLLEVAATLLVFVIVHLLKQIRDELGAR